jgi:hypothetical protein
MGQPHALGVQFDRIGSAAERQRWELQALYEITRLIRVTIKIMIDESALSERRAYMAQVKVFYDQTGNTLTVWFGDPQDEYICEETGDEVILMKDNSGQVIGFEKLNFVVPKPLYLQVAFETVST